MRVERIQSNYEREKLILEKLKEKEYNEKQNSERAITNSLTVENRLKIEYRKYDCII